MSGINIQSVIDMLAQSVGIEGAERIINAAIGEAGLPRAAFYTEDEFTRVCGNLEKHGGFIKIFATLVVTSEYREAQYQKIIDRERKAREDLEQMNIEMEMLNNELRMSNEKLAVANDSLKVMMEELVRSEKLAAIGLLAAGVSHELRNPLGSIKNICFYLGRSITSDNPRINEFLDLLSREVDTATKIVCDLLEYSRVKKINQQTVRIADLFEESLRSCSMPANVQLVREFSPEIVELPLDPDKMKQVFINIITNACQSMSAGGTLSMTVRRADDGNALPSRDMEYAAVSFTDTGCGMSPETASHIFDPLFTTKLKGIGLGLAIAREIVESHDGRISVASGEGQGSTFTIIMPWKRKEHV